MNAKQLKMALCQNLRHESGLEKHRPYLGMSGIGNCSRQQYRRYVDGQPNPGDQQHWYCWTGYLHENALVELLPFDQPVAKPGEIIAGYDERFRGHVDYVLGSDLIEIKSVGWDKFQRVQQSGPTEANVAQVQMYLRHGGFDHCILIYIARDVPHREFDHLPFWTFDIYPDPALADTLDAKARRILAAIDAGEIPPCDCGWCRD